MSRAGWTTVAFGDVVRLSKERSSDPTADGFDRYVGLEHITPNDLKIREWGDVADGTTFTSVFRPGQVLFGKRRAYQRKVALADFAGVCSGDIYVLEAQDGLLPELLPFICQTNAFFDHAVGTSAGSLSPRTNWKSLADYEFALPPLEEQRRIAEALAAIDVSGERLREAILAGRMQEMALFEHLTSARQPSSVALGELLVGGPRNGCSAPPRSEETGYWALALSAISPWGYVPGELKPVEPTKVMLDAKLSSGDFLISRSNTRELVGLPAIFDEDREDVSYPDTMMRLTPDVSRVLPHYLELFLRSPRGRQQIQSYAAGTSDSMKKINGANLRKVTVPLVTIDEQRNVVQKTSDVESAVALLTLRASGLAEIKRRALEELVGDSASS